MSLDLLATLGAAFVVALLGGVHCLGMCGGIVGALTLGLPHQARARRPRWALVLGYNAGRIVTYTLLGALVGSLGQWGIALADLNEGQRWLQGLAGVMMIALGLYLPGWWRGLAWVEARGSLLWRRLQPLSRQLLPVTGLRQAFPLGLLWGFLPCGLVYSVLIWALGAGSALQGGLLMLAFGVGTLPTLVGLGLAAQSLRGWLQRPYVRGLAGLLVLGFGGYQLLLAVLA